MTKLALLALLAIAAPFAVQNVTPQDIESKMGGLRAMPDNTRGPLTKSLALEIRQLSASEQKVQLASGLANLSTEGDFGHETMQEVATTLADSLAEHPMDDLQNQVYPAYTELAN